MRTGEEVNRDAEPHYAATRNDNKDNKDNKDNNDNKDNHDNNDSKAEHA